MASVNFNKAIDILAKRRQNVDFTVNERFYEVSVKVPRIGDIINLLAQTSIKLSRVLFSKDEKSKETIFQIRNENIKLQNELSDLLSKNNFPSDYLVPHYICSQCDDTGYVNGKKCKCLKEIITNLNIGDFNNSSVIEPKTFEQFSLKYYSDTKGEHQTYAPKETMENILNFCKIYANKFTKNSPNVLMVGDTGLGKTHLSLSIADVITKNGFVTMYSSALDLFRVLQNEYFGKGEPGKNTMQSILDADLVLIDDLGAEFESQFNISALYNIINSRLNANKPVLISTNLTLQEIENRYSSRVASRVMTLYKCLKFSGKDIRQIKLKSNEL